MNRLISFICSYSKRSAIERSFPGELSVQVMDWQQGMQMVRLLALLPFSDPEHEMDRWVFAWDDSPFSFGPPVPIKRFLQDRRERIYYVYIGEPSGERAFHELAVYRLREIYQKADGAPDTDAIAAHTFFVDERTGTGLERLIEMLF